MSEDRLTRLRELSRAAFGQRYRLELMLAVADSSDGIVCLTDLARALDVTVSNLQQPLMALVAVGLLTPLPRNDSRRRFYLRNPSSAWQWAAELYASCEDSAGSESERDRARALSDPADSDG
ncbi:hypothetical protein [Kibdelosporangium aridum]|nr:hypothetical protein [Kibdelosporangium aridum]